MLRLSVERRVRSERMANRGRANGGGATLRDDGHHVGSGHAVPALVFFGLVIDTAAAVGGGIGGSMDCGIVRWIVAPGVSVLESARGSRASRPNERSNDMSPLPAGHSARRGEVQFKMAAAK